jgi:hypothetical protein
VAWRRWCCGLEALVSWCRVRGRVLVVSEAVCWPSGPYLACTCKFLKELILGV